MNLVVKGFLSQALSSEEERETCAAPFWFMGPMDAQERKEGPTNEDKDEKKHEEVAGIGIPLGRPARITFRARKGRIRIWSA